MLGLHPRNVGQDNPVGENPTMAHTFINKFVKAHDNYRRQTSGLQDGCTLYKTMVKGLDIVHLGALRQ